MCKIWAIVGAQSVKLLSFDFKLGPHSLPFSLPLPHAYTHSSSQNKQIFFLKKLWIIIVAISEGSYEKRKPGYVRSWCRYQDAETALRLLLIILAIIRASSITICPHKIHIDRFGLCTDLIGFSSLDNKSYKSCVSSLIWVSMNPEAKCFGSNSVTLFKSSFYQNSSHCQVHVTSRYFHLFYWVWCICDSCGKLVNEYNCLMSWFFNLNISKDILWRRKTAPIRKHALYGMMILKHDPNSLLALGTGVFVLSSSSGWAYNCFNK